MINQAFIFKIAFRYFRSKKNEKFVSIISAFSLVGVMIGVAALIVVMSVMNGFHIELTKNIIGLNGDIVINPQAGSIDNYEEIKAKLLKQDYIKHVTFIAHGQALALGKSNNSGVLVKGINLKDLSLRNEIFKNVNFGSFDNFHSKNVIALGGELASNLGVTVGDKIRLISPSVVSTAFGSMPRSKEFKIIAIFNSGMYDYDSATILMPLTAAQNFLSLGNNINLIEINSLDPDKALSYSYKLQILLGTMLRVTSWQKLNAPFLSALVVERTAMFTILSLIIMVAAFNIIASLFMLVKDKTADIAILRTMGASTKQIMLIFIYNGIFIGLLGTTLGVTLGVTFSHNIQTIKNYLEHITGTKMFEAAIYFLYSLPSKVRAEDIIFITSLSIILCFLATIYPAYRASKLNPVDALRYE
ncbi:lipoprotein-releasing ABC transporter permease subunit [Rickettsia canadensis]|uniref:Lipoprotein releasing system, transmembrane protein n=1 Tax=Rickettsia canadensis str. CA410 TaxID=1105107 RepID=A0ABM5MSU6_RICCA|nr:lipoprotein-releasing ABC transporter permease subunit [Rickettsia canadensis]AFB21410.1 lipoprotein releasing system, transmembrane protein [Rickettsia canadensis str. CA410]